MPSAAVQWTAVICSTALAPHVQITVTTEPDNAGPQWFKAQRRPHRVGAIDACHLRIMPRLIDKHIIVARAADLPQKQSWNSPAAAPATAQPNMQEERGLMARQEVYHKFRHAVPINCTTAVEEEILGVALKSLPPGLQLRHFVV